MIKDDTPLQRHHRSLRRNMDFIKNGSSERRCDCGEIATYAIGVCRPNKINPEGVEEWLCRECFDKRCPPQAGPMEIHDG